MDRLIAKDIELWNQSKRRKPLILMGARQVGKTWLMEEFAKKLYPKDTVSVNLMKSERLRRDRWLICDGYIEMTQPNSPRSPTQKYRITEKGRLVVSG